MSVSQTTMRVYSDELSRPAAIPMATMMPHGGADTSEPPPVRGGTDGGGRVERSAGQKEVDPGARASWEPG
ncbi:hypothetical protein GCM10023347_38840 [Streptomyces chumphonensis]